MSRLTGFSPLVRKQIQDRSEGMCELCLDRPAEQYHHRRARGMGSTRRPETNQPANALHVCAEEHAYIESHRTMALQFGWLVSQHRTPAEVPVLRRDVWVLLGNGGDIQEIPEPAGGKVA